ncbi:MAG: hypothetical protein KatS3mg110_0392 [Pirellulaceae bacterium]|nr:MAG: hypothetical protein KatS3mg110_0392 [Pirellulaceae bacterium]
MTRFVGIAAAVAVLSVLTGCTGVVPDRAVSSSKSDSDSWDHHTQGLPFVFGYEKGLAEAKAQQKPAMLFVTTTWCGWCKKLAKESFRDEEIRRLLTDHFVCVIVDGDTEKQAVGQLNVRGYPHVIFVDSEGHRVSECRGYVPKEEFKKIVEKAIQRA